MEKLKTINVSDAYNKLFLEILDSVDTTDKQAGSMAIMLVADRIASELFWPTEQPLTVSDVSPYLSSAAEVDVTERAYQFICGAIAENQTNFSNDSKQIWGSIEGNYVFINKNVLCRIMEDAGFDFDAVKAKWHEKGYLERNNQGKYHYHKSIGGIKAMYVKVKQSDADDFVQNDELPL